MSDTLKDLHYVFLQLGHICGARLRELCEAHLLYQFISLNKVN